MNYEKQTQEANQMVKRHPIVFAIAIGVFIFVVVLIATNAGTEKIAGNEKASPTTQSKNLSVGDEGVLNFNDNVSDCSSEVVVGTDEETESTITKVSLAKDEYGITELITTGKAFVVPNCTKVKIIDTKVTTMKIRIIEGTQANKSGWVPYEFVK